METGEIIILEMPEEDFLEWEAYLNAERKEREAHMFEMINASFSIEIWFLVN